MRRGLAIAVVLAAVAVPSASGVESTIYPGVGIGHIRLGMTLAQVKKVLGAPQTVNKRAQLPGRRGYIEYGWNFSTLWVGFVNTKGVLHAAQVGTDLVSQKTANGVGVGTSPETLKRKLPVVPCGVGRDGRYRAEHASATIWTYCLFRSETQPVTVFHISCTQAEVFYCHGYRVGLVVVREQSEQSLPVT